MNERQSDFDWLQRFSHAGDQQAFRELVKRHIDLVHATALRKAGDAASAQEICQNVFTALARKAWQFAPDDSLPAWLYKTALLESQSWLRGEMRRRRREQIAAELGTTMKSSDQTSAFQALVPLLDEALLSLRERDRAALLLRYYESQSLREVGWALGVSEDAAQKRVATALERLSQFFQRRGIRAASASVAAAALQTTVASASTATTSLVVNAALQSAPPALAGVSALLARLTSLTKVQTAAVCLVLAAAPVAWQWREHRDTQTTLASVNLQLVASRNEVAVIESDVKRLDQSATKLETSLANARETAARGEELAQKFAVWKAQARARLFAADFRWSEDLPFVRIPKAVLPQLGVYPPVTPPGVIRPEARELLGLTPSEREQAETTLRQHFATMESVMEASRYETNQTRFAHVPNDAIASQVWALPALGETVKLDAEQLQTSLKTTLGDERWPMVADQLKSSGTDTLRRILSLDAGEKSQEMAVWIGERDGQLVAGYGWGEPNSSHSSAGIALSLFLPGAQFPDGGSLEDYFGRRQMPDALALPAMEWLRQQAEARLGKKGNP